MEVDRGVAIVTLNRPGQRNVVGRWSWPPGTPVDPTAG
jgi:enoyl-CoA hydratase/carnithine racemase